MFNNNTEPMGLYDDSLEKQKIQARWQENELAIAKEIEMSRIRIGETEAKAVITEMIRTDGYERRLRLREEAKEKARAVVEVLKVNNNGELLITSKNISVAAIPRKISNMRNPEITILRSTNELEPPCYKLACEVSAREVCLFLAAEKISRGNYLLGKMISEGIYFEINASKIKPLLLQLFGRLIETCDMEEMVPETEGWVKLADGRYKFFSEEDLTWEKVKELAK